MYGMDHNLWILGSWVVLAVLWILPFIILYFAIRALLSRSQSQTSKKTAIALLDEAYAGGEIDRAEYIQKRDDILGETGSTKS